MLPQRSETLCNLNNTVSTKAVVESADEVPIS
jgi:hypothetical protein